MQLVLSSSLGTARPLNVPFGSNRVASRRLSARSYHLRVRAEAEGAPEAASDVSKELLDHHFIYLWFTPHLLFKLCIASSAILISSMLSF